MSTTEATVTTVHDMQPGSMKMAKVGERRVVVIRTASGFSALDNACPHQGYGLATGSLEGDLVTCQWHNWKFRASDGTCVIGEEDVPCHQVRIEGDDVIVSVTEPTTEERLASLWPSLQRGVERDYRGQIARDIARLLEADAEPADIVALGLRHALPRTEWGLGHDMAVSADLLTLAETYDGIDKTLPLAHALAGFSESARGRGPHAMPEVASNSPDHASLVEAIEHEDEAGAVNSVRALVAKSPTEADSHPEARRWFIDAVSRHHYDYGHGAIFTQKAFELIERSPALTELLLTELARSLVYGTREDTLPYMRKVNRAIDTVDLDALAAAPSTNATGWSGTDALVDLLLDADQCPIDELVAAARDGAGIDGLLNVVSLAASHRLLRFDLELERDRGEEFGWLDITHALTYANAARWAWASEPGPRSARLVLLTAFLVFDSGRAERRGHRVELALPEPNRADIVAAVIEQDRDIAVAAALAGPADRVADQLEAASLEDAAGSFIVMAHMVKMAVAARHEATATGSLLPLAATARFMASQRTERFVATGARSAIDFVRTGQPPTR